MRDMLICMRTTILLPDELYAEVRRVAHDQEVTVTSVIEKALRAELRRMQSSEAKAAYRIRPLKGRGLKAGIDLDDNADLMARMERVDAT